MTHLKQYPHSVVEQDGTTYALARAGRQKKLCVQGDTTGFTGETTSGMLLCPLTADNAAVGAYVVGGAIPGWREMDTTQVAAALEVNGELKGPSLSGDARCDPKWVLVWTANFLSGRGRGLEAGDLITTGTACQPVPGGANMDIVARFAGLGEVRLAIGG